MASLTPHGKESQFFSLYEITDKGSSWLGPAVVGLLYATTGNMRHAFVFLLVMVVVPLSAAAEVAPLLSCGDGRGGRGGVGDCDGAVFAV